MQAICREIIYQFPFPLPEFREVLLKIHLSSPFLFSFHFISHIPAYSIINIAAQL